MGGPQTTEYVRGSGIRLHSHARAVNSSIGFAFNLFMPFREHGASTLEALLTVAVGFPVRVAEVEFEFHGPTGVLGECAGPEPTRRDKFTASDVAVSVVDDQGRTGVVPSRSS